MTEPRRLRIAVEIRAKGKPVETSHLHGDVKTALALAIVGFAPTRLIERLAALVGLFEMVEELPAGSAPAVALRTSTRSRARATLAAWRVWEEKHLRKASA